LREHDERIFSRLISHKGARQTGQKKLSKVMNTYKERRGGEDYEGMPIRLLVNPPVGWNHFSLSGGTGFATLLRHLFPVHDFTAQEEDAWVRADARLQAIFDDHRAGVQRAVLQNALVAVPPLQPLAKRKI